jgi:hypothetical protein
MASLDSGLRLLAKSAGLCALTQCECGRPVPHIPQERGVPVHDGPSLAAPPAEEANTESFLMSLVEPHAGHFVPFQSFERTRISLSFPHFSQLNS